MAGSKGPGMKIPVSMTLDTDKIDQGLNDLAKSMSVLGRGNNSGILHTMLFGGGNFGQRLKNSAKSISSTFGGAMRMAAKGTGVAYASQMRHSPGMKAFGKALGAATKSLKNHTRALTKSISSVNKALGATKTLDRATRMGNKAGGYAGKGLAFAGTLGLKGITGFLTGAFAEAIGAYEGQQNARLGVAPYMTGLKGNNRARRATFASGVNLGYNDIQAAQIQAMGARMGMGQSRKAGVASMELMRGFGAEGLMTGGGMMRRGNGSLSTMKTQFARVVAAGIKSGLDDARIGEFLQAANNYAEQQLAITPSKDSMKDYVKQLAMMQTSGIAGFKGKYGAQHLGQFDKAIKGAQGAQQSFLMRAFGFGKGASFFETLQRQEKGIGDPRNLQAVMDQLKSEYGANAQGGLSEQALVAFRSMGLGSTHTGQALSKLMFGSKDMSQEARQEKIKKIMDGARDNQLAPIQKRAYQVVASFGGVATTLAKRFSAFAGKGGEFYGVKKNITDAAIAGLGITAPIINRLVKPLSGALADVLKKNEKKLTGWINSGIDKVLWIGGKIASLIKAIMGLTKTLQNSWLFKGGKGGGKQGVVEKMANSMKLSEIAKGVDYGNIWSRRKNTLDAYQYKGGRGAEEEWSTMMKSKLIAAKKNIQKVMGGKDYEKGDEAFAGAVKTADGKTMYLSLKQINDLLRQWDGKIMKRGPKPTGIQPRTYGPRAVLK